MTPVSRATTGGRVYLDLQRLARETKRPTDELFRTYVLERFLWRVANSTYRDRLVLKGGLLLAALGERRPTADVDLLAQDLSNDLDDVAGMVAAVLSVGSDDGVAYDLGQLRVSRIRDDDVYPGVRVAVPARIDRARALLRVDVNVGDPVTPGPVDVEYPGLLHEPFSIIAYPIETVLAEKIVTMMDRGELNTRERDFADVYMLASRFEIKGAGLAAAIRATMAHRGSSLRLIEEAGGDLGRQRQGSWAAFVSNAGIEGTLPDSYAEVVEAIVAFADPLIAGNGADRKVWNPVDRRWR